MEIPEQSIETQAGRELRKSTYGPWQQPDAATVTERYVRLRKIYHLLATSWHLGPFLLVRRITGSIRRNRRYRKWTAQFYPTNEIERDRIREEIAGMTSRPTFSVIMPTYNSDVRWLSRAVASVRSQLYPEWQLCIADDGSTRRETLDYLASLYDEADSRIRIVFRKQNGHISAASNSALALATGQFIGLLDHDDELSEKSLYAFAKVLNTHPEADLIYTDEDKIDGYGRIFDPYFKPDWNRDLFYSQNCICHLAVFRSDIIAAIGGFRLGVEGSQDYDLALRFLEHSDDGKIHHIPEVLYHWRSIPGSVAWGSKVYARERAQTALREHFHRTGRNAEVVAGYREWHRARYSLPAKGAQVSVIRVAPTPLSVGRSTTSDFLFSREDSLLIHELVESPSAASGDVFLFVDIACQGFAADSVRELCSHALRVDIGVVGGSIVNSEGVQSAGALLGLAGFGIVWGGAYRGFSSAKEGLPWRAQLIQDYTILDSRCFAVARETYETLGGLDPKYTDMRLAVADLCLRGRRAGFRNVWTPYAKALWPNEDGTLCHSYSTLPSMEESTFRSEWHDFILNDPAYNPNLTLSRPDFSLADIPRNKPL